MTFIKSPRWGIAESGTGGLGRGQGGEQTVHHLGGQPARVNLARQNYVLHINGT